MKSLKKWCGRAFFIAVILVVAGAAAWTVWNVIESRRLERAIARLRAEGLPASPEDLDRRPVVPGADGGPLYRAAYALLETTPALKFEDWQDATGAPGAVQAEARRLLPSVGEALDLLHRAGEFPGSRLVVRHEWGFEDRCSKQIQKAQYFLLLRATVAMEGGQLDQAAGDLRDLFRFARALGREPDFGFQIWRFQVCRTGMTALERLLPRMESAVAALDRIDPDTGRGGLELGFEGESASFGDPRSWMEYMTPRPSLLGYPYYRSSQADYIDHLLALRAASRARPYEKAREKIAVLDRNRVTGSFFVRMLMPYVDSFVRSEARAAAMADLASIAARFLDHKKKRGAFPAAIADLEGPPAPVDPISGRPFEVRREEGVLVLASPGDEVRWRLP